jgi:hypothetical protein
LWFLAHHRRPADLHPAARPGGFQAELWRYDVAELFLSHPGSGRYFEFNLAPNGAWWCCEFTAARRRAESIDIAMPEVATFADLAADGSWLAAMAISPDQRFVSAADLGGGAPDFHRPLVFPEVKFAPLAE